MDSFSLLMDEPFAALDAQTRHYIQEWFLEIWEQTLLADHPKIAICLINLGQVYRAARRFDRMLEEQDWVDDAGLSDLAARLVIRENVAVPPRVILAGFDRQTPAADRLLDALRERGCQVETVEVRKKSGSRHLASFEDPDAELRAAGAWARDLLQRKPGKSVAIVAMHLERDAQRHARLVREGLAPLNVKIWDSWRPRNVQQKIYMNYWKEIEIEHLV